MFGSATPFVARRVAAGLLLASMAAAIAQTVQTVQTVRLRGTVQAVSASTVTVKERSGEVIELQLNDKTAVFEVYPIALADIRPGSFIGTAALPQSDGSQRAIAVTLFPEALRGTGEGHRPFDLQPQSTMTNATVAEVAASADGRRVQLKYKDGEKTLVVPEGTPVVTFRPADRRLLVPGASVSMSAQQLDGVPTALRINAGRDGFQLPY